VGTRAQSARGGKDAGTRGGARAKPNASLADIGGIVSENVAPTWAAWDLPRDRIATLFATSARFYRAAPWRTIGEHRILRAVVPGGRTWWVVVLGKLGVQLGLTLNERASDLERILTADDLEQAVGKTEGVIVTLTFDKRSEVPAGVRREIRRAAWEIAGSAAYPSLMSFNSLDDDTTQRAVADLVVLLDAVPRFVAAHRRLLESEQALAAPLHWTDESSGVAIELDDQALRADEGAFQVPETLAPCGPEGPGARPADTVVHLSSNERRALIDGLCDRFATWLTHSAAPPLTPEKARKHVEAADQFLDRLVWHTRSPWAVTEYDLRDYLYRGYPVMTADVEQGRSFLRSIRIFFHFLAESEGVRCPWADAILRDEYAFLFRWDLEPGGILKDANVDWNAVLTIDLHTRLLLPVPDPESVVEGSDVPGPAEWRLFDELHRHVLRWRDEGIRAGIVEPEALRAVLLERQREWMRTPNALVGGETPERAVPREQDTYAMELAREMLEKRRAPMTLFDAFRADDTFRGRIPEPQATLSLLLGHCLERIARARAFPPDLPVLLKNVSETFRPRDEEWPGMPELAERFGDAAEGRGVDALFERCLTMARDLVAVGGTHTASVVLRALREAFPDAAGPLQARAIMEQAEIAERLGERARRRD
jgi:hypothetical protein